MRRSPRRQRWSSSSANLSTSACTSSSSSDTGRPAAARVARYTKCETPSAAQATGARAPRAVSRGRAVVRIGAGRGGHDGVVEVEPEREAVLLLEDEQLLRRARHAAPRRAPPRRPPGTPARAAPRPRRWPRGRPAGTRAWRRAPPGSLRRAPLPGAPGPGEERHAAVAQPLAPPAPSRVSEEALVEPEEAAVRAEVGELGDLREQVDEVAEAVRTAPRRARRRPRSLSARAP